jgi:hypothetical protein
VALCMNFLLNAPPQKKLLMQAANRYWKHHCSSLDLDPCVNFAVV